MLNATKLKYLTQKEFSDAYEESFNNETIRVLIEELQHHINYTEDYCIDIGEHKEILLKIDRSIDKEIASIDEFNTKLDPKLLDISSNLESIVRKFLK